MMNDGDESTPINQLPGRGPPPGAGAPMGPMEYNMNAPMPPSAAMGMSTGPGAQPPMNQSPPPPPNGGYPQTAGNLPYNLQMEVPNVHSVNMNPSYSKPREVQQNPKSTSSSSWKKVLTETLLVFGLFFLLNLRFVYSGINRFVPIMTHDGGLTIIGVLLTAAIGAGIFFLVRFFLLKN